MPFREVTMIQTREVLRLWLLGHGFRSAARLAQLDRKTVRRYIKAAAGLGLRRECGEEQLGDELVAKVMDAVRPSGPETHGEAWRLCEANRAKLAGWLEQDLCLTKAHELLRRETGESIPYATLNRFAVRELGFGKRRVTVRVEDGKPGEELQVDFGHMGRMRDESARMRVVWGLVLTAVSSRHQFVWLTLTQRLDEVIEGFEQAWEFFGGVFRVVIIDNLKAVVVKADPCAPRLNDTFVEYAQARGFVIDAARVRRPDDKPRVERQMSYVRESFFRGEEFRDLSEARERAELWCRGVAGARVHGTTQRRPLEEFELWEKPCLLPVPANRYEVPMHLDVTVHRDHHLRVDRALYSVPTVYIGQKVHVRADRELVRVSLEGKLIKTHPRQLPGGRSTDPTDYPETKVIYATRDVASLAKLADREGHFVGAYAGRLLDGPLPWSRMRHVYRLLGLVRRFGRERVNLACQRALDFDIVDVTRIGRMLDGALENVDQPTPPNVAAIAVAPLRFIRSTAEFEITGRAQRKEEPTDEQL